MVQRLTLARAFIALVASGIADGQQTITIDPWKIYFNDNSPTQEHLPYADMNASVGDTVEFKWAANFHNLYIHPSGTCDMEGRILLGDKASGSGSHIFTADDAAAGTVTFACDVGFGEHSGRVVGEGGHCLHGQIVTFIVVAAGATSVEEVTTEARQPETDAGDAAQSKSIYDLVSTTRDFSTLATAIEAARLADVLSGGFDGMFTVFAPTNSAFEKLPTELLTKLLDREWQPQLRDVLLYHVLGSEVFSADLSDGMTSATLSPGNDITINLNPPRVNDANILVDSGYVDVETGNGVVHGVDSVLTPPSVSKNIVDIAVADADNFSTLVAAVTAAGLVDALSGEGPLTVFAPTNKAFAALADGVLDDLLLPENVDKLKDILMYHVVSANVLRSTLENGDVGDLETLSGDKVKVAVDDSEVTVNDSNVIQADVIANNGIIHVIDAILLPPSTDNTKITSSEPAPSSPTAAAPSPEQSVEEPSSSTKAPWMLRTVLVLIGTALVLS